jgi:hypothetical protein
VVHRELAAIAVFALTYALISGRQWKGLPLTRPAACSARCSWSRSA